MKFQCTNLMHVRTHTSEKLAQKSTNEIHWQCIRFQLYGQAWHTWICEILLLARFRSFSDLNSLKPVYILVRVLFANSMVSICDLFKFVYIMLSASMLLFMFSRFKEEGITIFSFTFVNMLFCKFMLSR